VPIDLRKIKIPAYFISTAEDHISPWPSTYKGARLLGGPTRFVLGGSGHIAGIVNPPQAKKYGFWINEGMPETPEQWSATAVHSDGSWWSDWQAWMHGLNGDNMVPARVPGEGRLKAIEDAPGSYVRVKSRSRGP
jgi:polyhydroxyalkanoate synthase